MCVKGRAGGSWGRLSCCWGLLVVVWSWALGSADTAQREKASLLILMDVLHNLFTTVEETITLRPLSGLVPCRKGSHRTVTSSQMSLEGRCSSLLCPRGSGSPAASLSRDTSASQTRFPKAGGDPAPGLGALEVTGRGVAAVEMKGDKWDLFCVTLAMPGCRDLV